MKRYYCTYFDRNYLIKAIALIESLAKHEKNSFILFIICLDELTRIILKKLNFPFVILIPLHEIENRDHDLIQASQNRSLVEYYWTLTPTVIYRILEWNPHIQTLTYLDADLFFYSSPDPVWNELGSNSVMIHEHRFSPDHKKYEAYGKYNVGLLSFQNDHKAKTVLKWWRERCNEWCYARLENNRYGDQLYLNQFPSKFNGVTVLKHIGAGVGPWNQIQYNFSKDIHNKVWVDKYPLIFYHFHSLIFVIPEIIIPSTNITYLFTMDILNFCFIPYVDALFMAIQRVHSVYSDFSSGLINQKKLSEKHMFIAKKTIRSQIENSNLPQKRISIEGDWDCYASSQIKDFSCGHENISISKNPEKYIKFMFGSLHNFKEIGDADRHYCQSQEGLRYFHQKIFQNPQSYTWQKIAQLFAEDTNFSTQYFTKTTNLKEMFIKRAEILQFFLLLCGLQLNYTFPRRSESRKKIRLGIIKEHYQINTETFASLPVFEYLDREQFEIYLYALQIDNSPLENYCRNSADRFILLPKDFKTQVQAIRNDDLDIIFFATNLTASKNKITTFLALHRLARVQTTSICSPVSTGMATMDYYIAGSLTAPLPESQEQYRECLANVEGSGICFHFPLLDASPVQCLTRQNWGATDKTTVFISGSNFHKIIPEVQETWAKILGATENSILVLFPFNPVNWGGYYAADDFIERMRALFGKYGVNSRRLIFEKALPTMTDVRNLIKLADVYLDSFPYSGATSLIDPLSVGLPTVVMEGNALRFRQGSAMLRELKIPELIVTSENSYIQLAVELANNFQKRQVYSNLILHQMRQYPPFLTPHSFAQKIGPLFMQLFHKWKQSTPTG
ncbi:glycosyltransferase family 2 [Candidatus Magnetomorum sp. HK-1]|nr:glycosyltransferase family 2 [Candidatus Magnetomorum sp. HK-1]